MSQKNFTSHGHPIPGAPYRPDQQPRNVARCGGPGLCPDCSREAGHGNRKNRMTTIDHQQAAIWAIAAALHGDACPADPDPGESCGCGDYEREAEIALTAATPHLRAAWEQEMARAVKRLPWNGVTHGGTMVPLDAVLALLEGGGACCEHSKCPGGSICCCQEGGAE